MYSAVFWHLTSFCQFQNWETWWYLNVFQMKLCCIQIKSFNSECWLFICVFLLCLCAEVISFLLSLCVFQCSFMFVMCCNIFNNSQSAFFKVKLWRKMSSCPYRSWNDSFECDSYVKNLRPNPKPPCSVQTWPFKV